MVDWLTSITSLKEFMLYVHVVTEHRKMSFFNIKLNKGRQAWGGEYCRHTCLELMDQIELTQILLRLRRIHRLLNWTIKVLNLDPDTDSVMFDLLGMLIRKGRNRFIWYCLGNINKVIYKRNYYDKLWQWIGSLEDHVQWG